MAGVELLVIQTGTANLASVVAGFRRAGTEPRVSNDPGQAINAEFLVLPGVGAMGAAMENLRRNRLDEMIAERIGRGRPTMAICLGLQILCAGSEESPGSDGLGIFPGSVRRFGGSMVVPQMGWNRVDPDTNCRLLEPGYAYFANSYRLAEAPLGWSVAWAEHGDRFIAALERGSVLACQFHPELSGDWGRGLIERWLAMGREGDRSC
jgi:imidazole glycerol-phosphate synthase subunit HisH